MKEKTLEELTKDIDDKVSWKVFVWAIGLIVVIMGWIISNTASASSDMSVIKTDISSMKTDISWIKDSLADKYIKK